ncbi:integral membrane protein [Xylaria telfairii]|nr:integral membrane protein [Xylaria telfairii]
MDAASNTNTIVGVVVMALAILSVAARFYVRINRKTGLKWDDWLVLVSLLVMIGANILAIVSITGNPTGPQKATVPTATEDYTAADRWYTKLSWTATLLYFSITSSTKLSILLLYNRLFSVHYVFRRLIIILSILVLIFWVGSTLADLLNCVPLKHIWINSQEDPRYCINYNIFWFSTAIAEAFLDILIILLPINVIMGLQFNRKQKIAVASVFLLGAIAIASSVFRAILGYIPGSREPDFAKAQLSTTIHCGAGIICACLPVCWALFVGLGRSKLHNWPGISWIRNHRHSWNSWHAVTQTKHSDRTLDLTGNG